MIRIALLAILFTTPVLAHDSPGSYWLHVYTPNWGHVFGVYPDRVACEEAGKLYTKHWTYHACVPVPPAVSR